MVPDNASGSLPYENIRILVTDLDNTLFYPDSEELPAGFEEWRDELRSRGLYWGIATGRNRPSMQQFFVDWGFRPDFWIARGRYITNEALDPELSFSAWNDRMDEVTEQARRDARPLLEELERFIEATDHSAERSGTFAQFETIESARRAQSFLEEISTEGLRTLRNRRHVGYVPDSVGKGRSLREVSRRVNWSEDRILCVGDGMNDWDLLNDTYDYHAVAVNNAEPELKELVNDSGGYVHSLESGHAVVDLIERLTGLREPGSRAQ